MTDKNFQEGVGQKIVEALKKQDQTPEVVVTETEQEFSEEPSTFNFNQDMEQTPGSFQSFEQPDTYSNSFETTQFNSDESLYSDKISYNKPVQFVKDVSYTNQNQPKPQVTSGVNVNMGMHMPPNVAVLRRLITQLPNGVTKQVGAQIIRQTMEALGISMHNVLHEAQQVQDGLNDSVKTCMFSIQEYKNNIKQLENQVLDYQKQIAYLNDLISLFVMTDKTR